MRRAARSPSCHRRRFRSLECGNGVAALNCRSVELRPPPDGEREPRLRTPHLTTELRGPRFNRMVKPPDQDDGPDEGTEQKIFDAADRVFARRGTDGARMQEIAEEAGVNKALLHYYYRTKDQLAEAVFKRIVAKFLPTVVQVMASDLELEEKVERIVHTYLDQLSRRPYIPGYVISEITHHPDRLPKLFEAVAAN